MYMGKMHEIQNRHNERKIEAYKMADQVGRDGGVFNSPSTQIVIVLIVYFRPNPRFWPICTCRHPMLPHVSVTGILSLCRSHEIRTPLNGILGIAQVTRTLHDEMFAADYMDLNFHRS